VCNTDLGGLAKYSFLSPTTDSNRRNTLRMSRKIEEEM
jgi:hypothetical protein